jgi:hypothetical protein
MISHTCQSSMSTIVTGEGVWKYWLILGILNHLSKNSVPVSEDQYSCRESGLGHNMELTHTESRLGWSGSGFFERSCSMFRGSELGRRSEVIDCLTLQSVSHRFFSFKVYGLFFVYYESLKWELKTKPINECRCDERLKTRVEESTRLACLRLVADLEHLKIETRLIDEMFACEMGEYVFLMW